MPYVYIFPPSSPTGQWILSKSINLPENKVAELAEQTATALGLVKKTKKIIPIHLSPAEFKKHFNVSGTYRATDDKFFTCSNILCSF